MINRGAMTPVWPIITSIMVQYSLMAGCNTMYAPYVGKNLVARVEEPQKQLSDGSKYKLDKILYAVK